MNYNDEFDSLIKDFKREDADPSATPLSRDRENHRIGNQHSGLSAQNLPPADVRSPQRPAQQAPQRPTQQAPQRPTQQAPQRPTQQAPQRPTQQAPQRPAQQRAASQEPPKQTFRVNIDDRSFYAPSGGSAPPRPPKPPRGGKPQGSAPQEDDEAEVPVNGVNRWVKALFVLIVVLGISIFLAFFALVSASDLLGLNKEDKPISIELQENMTMNEVASMLKDNGVITQPFTFQVYAGLKSNAEDFLPGMYELNSNMNYDQIMLLFQRGNFEVKEVKILFTEGETMREIANKLEENGVCKAQDFYDYLDKAEFPWEFQFLAQVPEDENRFRRFEGYLFPDTYIFNQNEDVSKVVLKFFNNFNSKISDDLLHQIAAKGMTVDQVLTLASIVQREAATVEDMKKVSSVFQNRLANAGTFPRLQSDVTIFYVRDNIKPFMNPNEVRLGEQDPNIPLYDSYDTYVKQGLPVGPICNPGMDAILAVLAPDQTDYLYFIADKEGVCHYAKTLEEHQQNIIDAELLGEAHGTDTMTEAETKEAA